MFYVYVNGNFWIWVWVNFQENIICLFKIVSDDINPDTSCQAGIGGPAYHFAGDTRQFDQIQDLELFIHLGGVTGHSVQLHDLLAGIALERDAARDDPAIISSIVGT